MEDRHDQGNGDCCRVLGVLRRGYRTSRLYCVPIRARWSRVSHLRTRKLFPGRPLCEVQPGKASQLSKQPDAARLWVFLDGVEKHRRRNRKSMPFRMRTGRGVRYQHQTCRRSSSSASKIQVSVLASAALLKGLAFRAAPRSLRLQLTGQINPRRIRSPEFAERGDDVFVGG
jgi:hypothetical protein